VPPFVAFEIARHGRLRDAALWRRFAVAAVVVGALTLPFMQPYLALRDVQGARRHLEELRFFSADAWCWLTAEPGTTLPSRWFQLLFRPEAALFPGCLLTLFAVVASVGGLRRAWRAARPPVGVAGTEGDDGGGRPWWKRRRVWRRIGLTLLTAGSVPLVLILAGGAGVYVIGDAAIRIQSIRRPLVLVLLGTTIVLWISSRARRFAMQARSPLAMSLLLALVAGYLSLGPYPQSGMENINGPNVFLWLYGAVPGFDGLRVPARFSAVALVFLTLAAAWGVRDLLVKWPSRAGLLTFGLSAIWIVETAVLPFPINVGMSVDSAALRAPPGRVHVGDDVPAIYRDVSHLPDDAVLVVFPIGDTSWEVRHVFDATAHWRRMVNGYSGYLPKPYVELADDLTQLQNRPARAWAALQRSGATHVLVRGEAYIADSPLLPDGWLVSHGAELLITRGTDRLYRVPR
jgi:hypothetical protein